MRGSKSGYAPRVLIFLPLADDLNLCERAGAWAGGTCARACVSSCACRTGLASALSPNSCIHYCSILGYAYAGLQADACQCGDAYGAEGPSTGCDTTCPGDLRQICGGEEAVSVWQVGTPLAKTLTFLPHIFSYKLAFTQTKGEPRRLTRPLRAQTACEGEARISQVDLISLFRKVDDSDNEKIELDELVDLFDGQNNNALVLPDCNDADFPDYWLGDGTCDDGSDGRANLNCKLYACDNGDCGGTC